MEELVGLLQSFPPDLPPSFPLSDAEYDRQIRVLLKTLTTTPASQFASNEKTNLLDVIDASLYTLSYLYILRAHCLVNQTLAPGSSLWKHVVSFLQRLDPRQVRYAGAECRKLLEDVVQGAEQSGQPEAAIQPLQEALLRLDPESSTLTSLHVLLIELCLRTRTFESALPILNHAIYSLPALERPVVGPLLCSANISSAAFITAGSSGLSAKLEYQDVLEYYLYGAMIYLATRDWDRALSMLEAVLTTPAHNTASMIQVEAYKKWILAHLLSQGSVPSLPRGIHGHTSKLLRGLARPYEVLMEAFESNDPTKLSIEIEAGQSVWQEDCNQGLVKQVMAAHELFALKSLAHIYSALPISHIITLGTLPTLDASGVKARIRHLIASGDLQAELSSAPDAKDEILQFVEAQVEPAQAEARRYNELVAARANIEKISTQVADAQKRLELTKDFIEASRKSRKARQEGSDATMSMDTQLGSLSGGYRDEEALEEM